MQLSVVGVLRDNVDVEGTADWVHCACSVNIILLVLKKCEDTRYSRTRQKIKKVMTGEPFVEKYYKARGASKMQDKC